MPTFFQDIRFAFRQLRRRPGVAVLAIATLGLGIGASTAIFAIVNAVLLRPLPYVRPDRLVAIWTAATGEPGSHDPASYPDFQDWKARARSLTGLAAFSFNRFDVQTASATVPVRAVLASPGFFQVLGTQPLIGRTPRDDEEHDAVVAISYRLWQSQFGASPDVVGRTIHLGRAGYTVVGVMPPGFAFPTPDIDLWTTLSLIHDNNAPGTGPDWFASRDLRAYQVVGRLRDGATLAGAQAELNATEAALARSFPDADGGTTITLQSIRDRMVGNVRTTLWFLLAATALILLLACGNIAHLMLVRATARVRELAVRRALGAERYRLVRQLLTESAVQGVLGGTLGVLIASWAVALLVRFGPRELPRLEMATIDFRTLAVALVAALVSALLFGLAPAIQVWRGSGFSAMRAGVRSGTSRSTRAFRSTLIAGEVAFALLVLTSAGLMIRSFTRLTSEDPGYRTAHSLVFHVDLLQDRYPTPAARAAAVERLIADLGPLPGVAATGASTSLPPTYTQGGGAFAVDGDPPVPAGHEPQAIFVPATAGYLDALQVPLLKGRGFAGTDDATAPPVAIVNETLAHRYFGTRDPIGQRITTDQVTRQVVGVVGDTKFNGLGAPVDPQIFLPFAQSTFAGVWVVVRVAGDPAAFIPSVRRVVSNVDAQMIPSRLAVFDDVAAQTVAEPRFRAWLLGVFGGIALLLSVIGIYGVVSFAVAQRTGEIGLRLALGAPVRSVVALVIGQGMLPVMSGIVLGTLASVAATRVLASLLYEVRPGDPMTMAAASLALALAALIAAWIPARRASRIDPLHALRAG